MQIFKHLLYHINKTIIELSYKYMGDIILILQHFCKPMVIPTFKSIPNILIRLTGHSINWTTFKTRHIPTEI